MKRGSVSLKVGAGRHTVSTLIAYPILLLLLSFTIVSPAQPSPDLSAPQLTSNISNNNLTISWTAVSGATGYKANVGYQSGVYTVNDLDLGNITSIGPFDLNALPAGTYYIAVSAYNATSSSPLSNEIAITIPPHEMLSAPHNLRYTLNGNSLTIQWDASSGATGYKIGLGIQSGIYSGPYDVGNILQIGPVDISGLSPGTYYLSVKSYNQSGESGYSSEIGIKIKAGTLSLSPTAPAGGAAGSYASKAGGSVSFTVTPSGADGSATASMSEGNNTLSTHTDGLKGSITWKGVAISGFGDLSSDEKNALENLAQSGLAEAMALIPLDASCSNVDLDLAAAQALLLPYQLVLKYTSCNPATDARVMAEKSACSYFGDLDITKMPKYVYMSNSEPIPYVFASMPFDEFGTVSADPVKCPQPSSMLEVGSLFAAPPLIMESLTAKLVESDKGPCGWSKCRGACGANCEPSNCKTKELVLQCNEEKGWIEQWEIINCGVHPACIGHDAYYDACDAKWNCNGTLNGLYFNNFGCHRMADRWCINNYNAGLCYSWWGGWEPFTGRQDFNYIKEPHYVAIPEGFPDWSGYIPFISAHFQTDSREVSLQWYCLHDSEYSWNVYRSEKPDAKSTGVLIGNVLADPNNLECKYKDKNVTSGKTYFYVVTTEWKYTDKTKQESCSCEGKDSNEVSVTIPATQCPPIILTANYQQNPNYPAGFVDFDLQWNPIPVAVWYRLWYYVDQPVTWVDGMCHFTGDGLCGTGMSYIGCSNTNGLCTYGYSQVDVCHPLARDWYFIVGANMGAGDHCGSNTAQVTVPVDTICK